MSEQDKYYNDRFLRIEHCESHNRNGLNESLRALQQFNDAIFKLRLLDYDTTELDTQLHRLEATVRHLWVEINCSMQIVRGIEVDKHQDYLTEKQNQT